VREGTVLVGKYRVERVLGQGGMGIVVAARHEQLDDRVAIKLMLPAVAANPEAVTRFVREARAAAKIKSEHVARVSDVGTLETGEPYMVMEYLEGADLSALLQHHGRLPVEQAADYLLQACEAIAQAHELGIVHRDLKPANLYVVNNRRDGLPFVKVLDFGISKMASSAVDSSMTKTSALMGSPLYMSPEQMNSARDVDLRSDIWSLGVIFYELLSGQPPFNGDTLPQVCAQILTAPIPDVRRLVPELPDGVTQVLYRCLERDPSRRFGNVDELATALAPFSPWGTWKRSSKLANTGARTTPGVAATSTPGAGSGTHAAWGETAPTLPVQRFPWLLAAAGLVLLVGGAGVAFALRSKPEAPTADVATAAGPPAAVTATAAPTGATPSAAVPTAPAATTSEPTITPAPVASTAAARPSARPPTTESTPAKRPTTPSRPATAPPTAKAAPVAEKPPPAKEPPPVSKPPSGASNLGGRL